MLTQKKDLLGIQSINSYQRRSNARVAATHSPDQVQAECARAQRRNDPATMEWDDKEEQEYEGADGT